MADVVMKAVQYSQCGGGASSLKHVTIPAPEPKKGELLLKVAASSVNPVDWKIQKGELRPLFPRKFPVIPGVDVAGEVVSVGSDVTDFAPGDKVVSSLELSASGALAEYAVAPAKRSAKVPPSVSLIDAACLPIAGLTALQALASAGVNIDGSYTGNVLVTAASGGVGLYAVQLARLSGAHVTATVGQRNIELLKSLGVDEVLDYKTADGAKLVSPSGKQYDVVVNGAGLKWSLIQPQLSPTGHVQDLTGSFPSLVNSFVKKLTGAKQKRSIMMVNPKSRDLEFLLDLAAQGKIKTIVDSKYSLDNVEEAWTKSMDGHASGKIVVTMTEE